MKRWALLFLIAMFLLTWCWAQAEGTALEQFLTPDTCEHRWYAVSLEVEVTEYENGVVRFAQDVLLPKTYIAVGSWHAEVTYVLNSCSKCGVEQYMPEAREFPHRYRVTDEKSNGDMVTLSYTCDDCGHIRRETLSLAAIRATDAASTEVDCMHGGVCPTAGLFTDAELGRYVLVDGRPYSLVRVQMEEDGQMVWKVAHRLHCPFCRRPQMLHIRKLDESCEDFESLPEMSYEEFMTVKTEADLPYRVIDRLRMGA